MLFEIVRNPLFKITSYRFSQLDSQQVEDIIEDSIFRAAKKAFTYKGCSDQNAWNWIRKIAYHAAIDHCRREKRIEYVDDIEPLYPHRDISVESRIILRQQIEKVWSQLNEQQKEVLSYIIKGYPNTEIAAILGLTPARISQIYHQILRIFESSDENNLTISPN